MPQLFNHVSMASIAHLDAPLVISSDEIEEMNKIRFRSRNESFFLFQSIEQPDETAQNINETVVRIFHCSVI